MRDGTKPTDISALAPCLRASRRSRCGSEERSDEGLDLAVGNVSRYYCPQLENLHDDCKNSPMYPRLVAKPDGTQRGETVEIREQPTPSYGTKDPNRDYGHITGRDDPKR